MGGIVGLDHRVDCLDLDGGDRGSRQWLDLAPATWSRRLQPACFLHRGRLDLVLKGLLWLFHAGLMVESISRSASQTSRAATDSWVGSFVANTASKHFFTAWQGCIVAA